MWASGTEGRKLDNWPIIGGLAAICCPISGLVTTQELLTGWVSRFPQTINITPVPSKTDVKSVKCPILKIVPIVQRNTTL